MPSGKTAIRGGGTAHALRTFTRIAFLMGGCRLGETGKMIVALQLQLRCRFKIVINVSNSVQVLEMKIVTDDHGNRNRGPNKALSTILILRLRSLCPNGKQEVSEW